jgi:hypothetical protein
LLLQRIDSQFPWSNDEDEFNEKEEKEVIDDGERIDVITEKSAFKTGMGKVQRAPGE